jgi:hypothetical protein
MAWLHSVLQPVQAMHKHMMSQRKEKQEHECCDGERALRTANFCMIHALRTRRACMYVHRSRFRIPRRDTDVTVCCREYSVRHQATVMSVHSLMSLTT